jgi:hypothetical protein
MTEHSKCEHNAQEIAQTVQRTIGITEPSELAAWFDRVRSVAQKNPKAFSTAKPPTP